MRLFVWKRIKKRIPAAHTERLDEFIHFVKFVQEYEPHRRRNKRVIEVNFQQRSVGEAPDPAGTKKEIYHTFTDRFSAP